MLVTGGCAPLQVLPLTVLGRDARPQPVRGRVWGPCWHTDTQCQPPVIVASPAIYENGCSQIIKDTMRSLVLVRLTLMPQCPGSWETQLAGPWSCVVMPGSSSLVSDVTEQMRLCRVPPQPARARAEWGDVLSPAPGPAQPLAPASVIQIQLARATLQAHTITWPQGWLALTLASKSEINLWTLNYGSLISLNNVNTAQHSNLSTMSFWEFSPI